MSSKSPALPDSPWITAVPIEIRIHAPDFGNSVPYEEVAEYLRALPGIRAEGNDFTYSDEESHIFFVVLPGHSAPGDGASPAAQIGPDPAGRSNFTLLRVPNENAKATIDQVSEFAFNLANRFGWSVYGGDGASALRGPHELESRLNAPTAAARTGCLTLVLGALAAVAAIVYALLAAALH